jgi:hypothetical protein
MWHVHSLRDKEENMARKRLTVKKIEEVIRLMYEAGLSNRALAGASISIFRIASMLTLFSLLGLMLISPF